MPEPPHTEEGWYVLHDFRSVNWPAWRAAPDGKRERALAEGVEYLRSHADLRDVHSDADADADAGNDAVENTAGAGAGVGAGAGAGAGATAVFSVLGHKADLLVVHLRPSTSHLDTAERQFAQTTLADYTSQVASYVSVTEASGYGEKAREHLEARADPDRDADEDSSIASYLDSRVHPSLPDAEHVCFYPMDKRRGEAYNWYDLPFDERAEHIEAHGRIGRKYAGKVTQIISGSIGLDDWEWGVTLFADDPTDIKHLLNEMRFDPSSSRYAEFGPFYFGRRFPPEDLDAFIAGEPVPTGRYPVDGADEAGAEGAGGEPSTTAFRDAVDELGLAEEPAVADAPDDAQGLLVYSDESAGDLRDEVDGLRGNFEHYDSHVGTTVHDRSGADGTDDSDDSDGSDRSDGSDDSDDSDGSDRSDGTDGADRSDGTDGADRSDGTDGADRSDGADGTDGVDGAAGSVVVSVWTTERAADTARGFLAELPGVTDVEQGPVNPGSGAGGGPPGEGGPATGTGSTGPSAGGGHPGPPNAGDTDSRGSAPGGAAHGDHPHDGSAASDDSDTVESTGDEAGAGIRDELEDLGVYGGQPHGEDVYALVLYSEADGDDLLDEVEGLGDGFDRYETHVRTSVYEGSAADRYAVVSIWETGEAANTAADYLADLPGIVGRAGEESGFGTMGMFYTVKSEHREDFVEKFDAVGDVLDDMDGHHDTDLMVNVDDENDMFIASQWRSKDDAMTFFRSDDFSDTVSWGRDVLADRPRHVFLA